MAATQKPPLGSCSFLANTVQIPKTDKKTIGQEMQMTHALDPVQIGSTMCSLRREPQKLMVMGCNLETGGLKILDTRTITS